MAQRRERPPVQRSDTGIAVRLPDGTTMAVPGSGLRGPVTSDLCCFCGRRVEHSDSEEIRLSVRWVESGEERDQSWRAHHTCLAERMHEAVKGAGPFFGD
jgi:hypothetical protein